MFFNSSDYVVFFAVVFAAYWLLRRTSSARVLLLLGASYLFYGWWDVRFLYLVVLSTAVDYCAGQFIANGQVEGRRRLAIAAFVLGCAALFVLPDWASLREPGILASLRAGTLPGTTETGRWTVGLSAAGLALFECLHPIASRLGEVARRRIGLLTSVSVNLGILGFFKYWDFFAKELAALLHYAPDKLELGLILPVGISFYTFQTMSYTIDVYRREIPAEDSFSRFALFVAFFPQLVAGPIVRASSFIPQIALPPVLRSADFERGLALIFWGLVKKVVIADYLGGQLVDPFWSAPGDYGGTASAVAIVGYAFQIYGDFSGYSDIAIGSARLLGFELGLNFNSPYRSSSPSEFWTRWHISLSSWLRDYLYIPLGGNRRGRARTYINLALTMLIGGLWHGASWMFVAWGAFHGALLILGRLLGLQRAPDSRGVLWLQRAGMFALVCVGWVLFRSPDIASARSVFASLGASRGEAAISIGTWCVIALAVATHFPARRMKERIRSAFVDAPAFLRGAAYAVLIGIVMNIQALERPFIYFQF